MLVISALLLILVGVMHSFLGGRRLIAPLLQRDDFPAILGSQRNGRITLWFGWHALTLFWWAQAIVLVAMNIDETLTVPATLVSISFACLIVGLAAVVLTKGRHLSWIFFFPISAVLLIEFAG